MKKLSLVFLCVFFVSCVSFPDVKYIGDSYYPEQGYFESRGVFVGGIFINFRTINGTDKIIVIAKERFDNIVTVTKTDKVLLRFIDGKEISLSYNNRVSQYVDGHFELTATSGVIEDFGTIEIVRMETDDGYMNFEATKKQAKMNTKRFNMIQAEATAMYGDKE